MATKMTTAELTDHLNAKIRMKARWNLNRFIPDGHPGNLLGDGAIDIGIISKKAAQTVYDDIISDYSYSDDLLKATRAVKNFNVAYVASVIKKAITAGVLTLENARVDGMVAEAFTALVGDKKLAVVQEDKK